MFTNMQIRSLILKIHLAVFNMQMKKEKFFLWKRLRLYLTFTRLRTFFLFFLRTYFLQDFPVILFPEILLSVSQFRGKNSKSQESKTQDFSPVTFCPRTSENLNFLPKFLFPGFFPSNFFFYDSYKCPLRTIVRILEYAVNIGKRKQFIK